jgi:PAP2 superfamily
MAKVIRLMAMSSEPASSRPVSAFVGAPWRAFGWPQRLLATGFVAVWLIWVFDAINNLAPVRQGLAQHNGERVLTFEHSLHLAPEHALNTWLTSRAGLSQIVVFWYVNVHIVAILVVLAVVWWLRPDLLKALLATLMLVSVIALAVFWSFPTAPLRMLPGGYLDTVASAHHLPVWRLGATAVRSNQLCSMPSLHVACAVWCSIAIWQISRRGWARVGALIYPLLTTYAVMATANHYLADAVAGAAITLVVFFALNRLVDRAAGRNLQVDWQSSPLV